LISIIFGELMKYRISGKLDLKEERSFSKQLEAENEVLAREKIYIFFGNVYRLKRNKITIAKIVKA